MSLCLSDLIAALQRELAMYPARDQAPTGVVGILWDGASRVELQCEDSTDVKALKERAEILGHDLRRAETRAENARADLRDLKERLGDLSR
jgi:hypothetical protein